MVSEEPRTGADRTAPLAYARALAAGVLMGAFVVWWRRTVRQP